MYLSLNVLKGFGKYKYNSKDTSPISKYVMHPFWDWLVKFVPLWIAPNMLTFVGFLMSVFNFLLLAYLDPVYKASNINSRNNIPSYIWLLVGVLHFTAHQLDGIDGKQARRTGTSSPLGELFDHGCDSWTVSILPLTLISIFGSDDFGISSWEVFIVVWSMALSFILSHWEKYLTGVLYLPWVYDIGQLSGTLFLLISSFNSTDTWKVNFPWLHSITIARIGAYSVMASVVAFSLPITLFNVHQSYRLRTGRMLDFVEALRPLASTFVLIVASTAWAILSPTNILSNHTRLFVFVLGTATSNITVRLIISQMSVTRADLINPFSVLFVVVAILVRSFSVLFTNGELMLLWFLCIVFTLGHVLSAICIVRDLCAHLNIDAFSISRQLKNPTSTNGGKDLVSK